MIIEEKVKSILCELSGEDCVENDFSLQEDLALNSLMMVMLLIRIEEDFSIELDETDMNPFDLSTVQSVIDMVAKYCDEEGDKDEKDE